MEYLAANWSATPISYEGIPWKNLNAPGQPLLEEGDEDFIIFEVHAGETEPASVPLTCVKRHGYLSAAVYVKEDTGTRQAKNYLDQLNALFEYKTLPGDLRMKQFLDDGAFLANGWAIYACQWPYETSDNL
jgi:hypothetical protein